MSQLPSTRRPPTPPKHFWYFDISFCLPCPWPRMAHPYLSHTIFSSVSILLNLNYSAYIGVSINLLSIFSRLLLKNHSATDAPSFLSSYPLRHYTHKMLTRFLRDEPFLPSPIPNTYQLFLMSFHVTDLLILVTTIRTTNTQPYYINALLLHTNSFCPAICVPPRGQFFTTHVNNYQFFTICSPAPEFHEDNPPTLRIAFCQTPLTKKKS